MLLWWALAVSIAFLMGALTAPRLAINHLKEEVDWKSLYELD